MPLDDILRNLCAELRFPPPSPDADGAIAIRFDDTVVRFGPVAGHPGFALRAHLGRADLEDLTLLEALLAGNLFPPGPACGVLCADFDGEVFLQHWFDTEGLAYPAFAGALEGFLARAVAWRAGLAAFPSPAEAA
ncbi:type III secretion system chaperone [Ramlibacter sp. MAHUQ-53]|uniref:type III secretion system chaperone n=1 Tax=unclassified Ramlibacter TaxID=2617605 RepID=UPI0036416754